MNLRRLGLAAALAVTVAVVGSLVGAPRAEAYSNSRLMDDQIFDNYDSMGDLTARPDGSSNAETAIQNFLAGKGPCLVNFMDVEPNWNGTAWSYTGSVKASRIIAKAARMWGLNPQVILATLQKEQSLISGTACDGWRYNAAMGYGCPDSGGCNPKYAGFTRQVLWGAWQLKFNKERSLGNVEWDGDGAITYVGYMTQGERKRCLTCSPFTYDGNATIDGQVIKMETGATASLYTYTPHLGQSFPGIFQSWFGPVLVPTYAAAYAGQSGYPTIIAGNTATGFLKYRNTGNITWYDDTSIGTAPAGSFPIHLATARFMGHASPFGATWQSGKNRPALNFAAVYESNGTTLATNQHVAAPGQIVRFDFTFTVASNQAPGTYNAFFQPVAEGTPNGAFADTNTYLTVTVQPKTWAAGFVGQSAYPTVVAGNTASGMLLLRNTGNQIWYDDSTVGSAPGGSYPVHLATARFMGRASAFGATWQSGKNRPGMDFANVYESDGVTLASNQNIVQVGQVARFTFTFTVPQTLPGGVYREYFMPVAEGTPNGAFADTGTYIDVTVTPAIFRADYAGQSAYPTLTPGSTTTGFIQYRNSSNQPWYDDVSIGTAPAGMLPVHLATSRFMGRSSAFGATWQRDRNRPGLTFSAVYESDGVTLAGNQHVVNPGQIARFSFTFTAAANQPRGTYREYFQPVAEGSSNGAFPDPGTYLDVRVQ